MRQQEPSLAERFGRRVVDWGVLLASVLTLVVVAAPANAGEQRDDSYAVEQLLSEIRTRNAQLDRRQRALADRERTLVELESVAAERLREVSDLQDIVESRIAAWDAEGGERIAQLAKIYEAMPPPNAARLVDELDANLATQILKKMKHKKSAAVLALISQSRALTVSRQVAHPLSFEPNKADGEDL